MLGLDRSPDLVDLSLDVLFVVLQLFLVEEVAARAHVVRVLAVTVLHAVLSDRLEDIVRVRSGGREFLDQVNLSGVEGGIRVGGIVVDR